jgi:cell division control protein 24
MQQLQEITADTDNDPVESMWELLRAGYPLLAIFNVLQPEEPLVVLPSESTDKNRPKLAILRFSQGANRLNPPPNESFIVNDLTGTDTTGLVKVRLPIVDSLSRDYKWIRVA